MRNEEWSIGIGLRRAVVHLISWSVGIAIVWGVLLFAGAPWINQIPVRGRGVLLVYSLIAASPGLAAGYLLFHQLQEKAGFTSLLLSGFAVAFTWGSFIAGALVADSFRSLDGGRRVMLIFAAGAIATVEIIYETFADG